MAQPPLRTQVRVNTEPVMKTKRPGLVSPEDDPTDADPATRSCISDAKKINMFELTPNSTPEEFLSAGGYGRRMYYRFNGQKATDQAREAKVKVRGQRFKILSQMYRDFITKDTGLTLPIPKARKGKSPRMFDAAPAGMPILQGTKVVVDLSTPGFIPKEARGRGRGLSATYRANWIRAFAEALKSKNHALSKKESMATARECWKAGRLGTKLIDKRINSRGKTRTKRVARGFALFMKDLSGKKVDFAAGGYSTRIKYLGAAFKRGDVVADVNPRIEKYHLKAVDIAKARSAAQGAIHQ